ncbi:Dabb family protein [Bacillus sp. HMF5848]|nr:Dabb family protein [Bacillus sp. HMF5848]
MAIFSLKYDLDAPETSKFLEDGKEILSSIPTVENFEVVYQISPKTDFNFGFSMEFTDKAAYEAYNNHPMHIHFVKERWEKEVERFQEIDFQAYT